MAASSEFITELNHILDHRRAYLEATRIPVLREQFRIYHGAYQGILNVLLRKGLVSEDPYKSDQRISEVSIPTDTAFLGSEAKEQTSIRLAEFDNQLGFLNNYVQFTLDYLNLKRVRTLAGLAGYIKWPQLSETSAHMLTCSVAQCITRLRAGGDGLSLAIVTDNHRQLIKSTNLILQILREISDYQCERYKLEVRERVLPHLQLGRISAPEQYDRVLPVIKKGITAHMHGRPYIGELISQILEEDHGENGQEAKQAVFDRLRTQQEAQPPQQQQPADPRILSESLRTMARASRYIETAVLKLRDNNAALSSRQISLGERLRGWIDRVVRQAEQSSALIVEYVDEQTSAVRHERIEFEPFCDEALKRAKVLTGIQSRMGTTYRKLQHASERQVFRYVNRELEELFLLHRRLEALQTYIRSEMPRESRSSLLAVDQELEALHGCLVRANKKKHAYAAKREETEQLQRLGSTDT